MDERPAPRIVVATIRLLQGDGGAIDAAALGCAGGLLAMMLIRVAVAWQTGLL